MGPTFNSLIQNCWVGKWEGPGICIYQSALLFPSAHLWESPTTQELGEGQNPGSSSSREQENFTRQKDRIRHGPAVRGIFPRLASEVSFQQEEGN